jgi:hypothetical protein
MVSYSPLARIADMPRKTAPDLPPSDKLVKIASDAIKKFRGPGNELESALGMLFMGHAFGWRVIYILHSIATVRKYERILGIVAKDVFPEQTKISDYSLGFRIAEGVSNFWKAVKGEHVHKGFRDRTIEPR